MSLSGHTLTISIVTLCLAAAPAHGQPAASTDQGGAVADAARPGAYEHDGVYVRLGLGFGGFANGLAAVDEGADGEHATGEINGVASAGEVMLGGAVAPNWIVGGGVFSSSVLVSDYSHIDGEAVPRELTRPDHFMMIGPFTDWYLGAKPRAGQPGSFHLQGGVAFAMLSGFGRQQMDVDEDHRAGFGAGVMLGGGYEWWVDEQWGLGVLARLTAAGLLERDSNDDLWFHGAVTFPALLFTATYN